MTERFVGSPCEDLGSQNAREVAILSEAREEVLAHIGDGAGEVALAQEVVHQVAQAVAASMILHPPGLEGGVLAVIGKNDQLLLCSGKGVDHTLLLEMY